MVPTGILDKIHQIISCEVTSYMCGISKHHEPVFVPNNPQNQAISCLYYKE